MLDRSGRKIASYTASKPLQRGTTAILSRGNGKAQVYMTCTWAPLYHVKAAPISHPNGKICIPQQSRYYPAAKALHAQAPAGVHETNEKRASEKERDG